MRRIVLVAAGVGALVLTSALPAQAERWTRIVVSVSGSVEGSPVHYSPEVSTTCGNAIRDVLCDTIEAHPEILEAEINALDTHLLITVTGDEFTPEP